VTPNNGTQDGGTWVTIEGSFDTSQLYYVHIGDTIHQPAMVTSWAIGIVTKASSVGTKDVAVHGQDGVPAVEHAQAYSYTARPSSGGGDGGNAPPPGGGDGGNAPPPGSGDDGGAPPPGAGDSPPPSSDLPPPSGGTPDGNQAEDRAQTLGEPFETEDGMRLDRMTGGPLAVVSPADWNQRGCVNASCQGVQLAG
jgi:hypothetical protein